MHRTTLELLSGRACTLGILGACTPARAMRQRSCTASAPPLHQHAQRHLVGAVANMTRKDIRIGISASVLVYSGLRQPSREVRGRPRAPARHTPAGGLQISVTPHRVNTFGAQQSDRSIRLRHRRLCTQMCPCVCHTRPGIIALTLGLQLPPQRVVSATIMSSPQVRILVLLLGLKRLGEHRWRHIEHLLFEYPCIPGLGSSVAVTLLRDDLFRVCFGSDHAEAVLLAAFSTGRTPAVAATACVVPFLLAPAPALGRMSPWHMKSQCLDLVAAFLPGVPSAVFSRQPPTASMLANVLLPARTSVHAWSLRLRAGCDFAPERLRAPDPVLHVSAPVHRGAEADAACVWRDVLSVTFFC